MNRYITSCFLLLAAMSTNATDRVVSPNGTYNTISSAIAASSDGDRVLVTPATYNENLVVSTALSILSNQEGVRYTVTGSLTLQNADGKSVTLSGARILGGVRSTGSYLNRTVIGILDSYTGFCDLDEPGIRVEMYGDSLVGDLRFSSGTIAGCTLLGTALISTLIRLQGSSTLPEDIWIVGNILGSETSVKKGILVTSTKAFHIENNVFIDNQSASSAVDLALPGDQAGPVSSILNNSFIKWTTENFPAVMNSTGTVFNLILKNNAVVRFSGGVINTLPSWPQLTQSHNVLASPTWLSPSTGQPVIGSPLINAGDPDPRYLDLDLTVNDAGCYGGSNSRENFTTPMGSAVVGFMQAPRVVAQGEPVNISVTGFDR